MVEKQHRRGVVVHVMPKEKFTFAFTEFTFETFPEIEVAFVVYGDDDAQGYVPFVDDRVVSVGSSREVFTSKQSVELLNGSNVIILNWVNMSMLPSMWRYLPKTYLLFWGGDYAPYCSICGIDIKRRAKKALLSKSIERARGVMALLPSDLERISVLAAAVKESYRVDLVGTPRHTLEGVEEVSIRSKSPLKVLVGNSATPSNRHIAALKLLSRFAEEDIRLYAPLSYGDMRYRDEVIACGSHLFGSKFVPLVDYMTPAEYTTFLSGISIGVFNHDRQQGLGNIRKLLRMGSKVYISSDSGVLNDLCADGSCVHLTESIQHCSFSEFSQIDEEEAEVNRAVNSPERQYDQAVSRWRIFYRRCTRDGVLGEQ